MDFIVYLLAITFVSIGSFWIIGVIYGLFHRPAIYFPISLAAKMAVSAILGTLFVLGIGGVVLSTVVFNIEMMKRRDYNKWTTIIAGVIISVLGIIVVYVSAFALAWQIFD
jgi:hypothetical protein